MSDLERDARRISDEFREQVSSFGAPLGVAVLGSGWKDAVVPKLGNIEAKVDFAALKTMKAAGKKAAPGHGAEVLFVRVNGNPWIVFTGRAHPYQLPPDDLSASILPAYLAKFMGAKGLLLTNAAGALHPAYEVGEIVGIKDFIDFGPQEIFHGMADFCPMGGCFSERLLELYKDQAHMQRVLAPKTVVYVRRPGPRYETPAEVRALLSMGADVVGMSTVQDVQAARAGLPLADGEAIGSKPVPVLALTCVTNVAGGKNLNGQEVLDALKAAGLKASSILLGCMGAINRYVN